MALRRRGDESQGVRGAIMLVLGASFAQAITVGATPFLARLYSPEAFGYFFLVIGVSVMLAPAVGLKLESALMLPTQPSSVSALYALSALSAFVLSVLAGGVLEVLFALGMLAT